MLAGAVAWPFVVVVVVAAAVASVAAVGTFAVVAYYWVTSQGDWETSFVQKGLEPTYPASGLVLCFEGDFAWGLASVMIVAVVEMEIVAVASCQPVEDS